MFIQMCPLILELKKHKQIDCKVCLTGQHREMLRQVMEAFGIQEDYNLDIMREWQTLTTITTSVLEKMDPVLREAKPDIVLVHGDTTTSFAAALAAFYQQIPVGHVEAGTMKVAGVEEDDIFNMAGDLLSDTGKYAEMARAVNPYGDGHASERIVDVILKQI